LVAGTVLLGVGGSIQLKAAAAQWMLEYAWQNTLTQHKPHRPWPWADTWPVAKLKLGDAEELIVLNGVSGQALAFGPGKMSVPESSQNESLIVMAGHRDTHFGALKEMVVGDDISIQDVKGQWRVYSVSEIDIVNAETHMIDMSVGESGLAQLMLVTCYPFNALQSGGPLRYVVTAIESI
jgi:sortase A